MHTQSCKSYSLGAADVLGNMAVEEMGDGIVTMGYGLMAEWLGTALQKLIQRFKSASDLKKPLAGNCKGLLIFPITVCVICFEYSI